MLYSEAIEARVEDAITAWQGMDKKKMFGGICYLLHGNMCFGIWKDFLIVRAGPEVAGERLQEAHVRPFDITGRPMKGWVMVGEEGIADDDELADWLTIGRTFAMSLPPK